MLEEKAKRARCPHRVDKDGDFCFCYTVQCMAWIIDQTIDETDEHGHCELIHTR